MLTTTHSKMVALFTNRIANFSTDNFIRFGLLKNLKSSQYSLALHPTCVKRIKKLQ